METVLPNVSKQAYSSQLFVPTAGDVCLSKQSVIQGEILYIQFCQHDRFIKNMIERDFSAGQSIELDSMELDHIHNIKQINVFHIYQTRICAGFSKSSVNP